MLRFVVTCKRLLKHGALSAVGLVMLLGNPALAQKPISVEMSIPIGGIRQWITIHGTDSTAPVLLFLHGGPGNSVLSYADRFTGELRKKFVVVQWDQRASGRTAELNTSSGAISLAVMLQDASDMVNYLRRRFQRNKIFVMGHSWGGFLALMLATSIPEQMHACIAVSPMVYQSESDRRALTWMMDRAAKAHNEQALDELKRVKIPFSETNDLYFHRGWLTRLDGLRFPSYEEIDAWAKKWLSLYAEACEINFFTFAPTVNCPLYVFVGDQDYQTNYKLTQAYYNIVQAPAKKLYLLENVGHSIPSRAPDRLQQAIIDEILPKY